VFRFHIAWTLFALAVALAGCGQSDRGNPAGGCVGDGCIIIDHGSKNPGTGTGADAGTDGSTGGVDVTGSVYVILSTTFGNPTLFYEKATVSTAGASGGTVSDEFAGGASAQFELENVPAGTVWVHTEPASTSSAMDTYSAILMSDGASVTVPVVDRTVMDIVVAMTNAVSLNTAKAQVVLQLYQNSTPVAGVSVSNNVGAAAIAYDQGSGYYAETAATGSLGFVVLLNTTVPTGGNLTVQLTDNASKTYSIGVPVAADTVTLASIAL